MSGPPPSGARPRFVLVTGPSGAGRSTTVNALEDMDYEAVDNLPLSLVRPLAEATGPGRSLVLGIDTRNREFAVDAFRDLVGDLRRRDATVEVLYVDCAARVLERRFSETRRRHPMAPAESPADGIERELELLAPIRDDADYMIDTTDLTPHDLRAEIARWFDTSNERRLAVSIHSFSYKRGMPRGIDMVFDCRFLSNPYWEETLRSSDGRDPAVQTYVSRDDRFDPFFEKVKDITEFLLPAYVAEGKSHLSLGFGCTGGQHRSVAMADRMAKALREAGWQVAIRHHELDRRAKATPGAGSSG